MLQITVPAVEYYDEKTNTFISTREQTLQLEHSLVSVSRWESKWHKPFLNPENKTNEECADYLRCMTITQNVDPCVYNNVTPELYRLVDAYIDASMTATWFSDPPKGAKNHEIITAEIIYYWMISLNIPFECQKWHLNKLLALIRVCNNKNAPKKKMSRKDIYSQNRELNAARKKHLNTKG